MIRWKQHTDSPCCGTQRGETGHCWWGKATRLAAGTVADDASDDVVVGDNVAAPIRPHESAAQPLPCDHVPPTVIRLAPSQGRLNLKAPNAPLPAKAESWRVFVLSDQHIYANALACWMQDVSWHGLPCAPRSAMDFVCMRCTGMRHNSQPCWPRLEHALRP